MPVSIAAIKIAQKNANLPDGEYRELLRRIAGVESSTLLTPEQRVKVYVAIKKRSPSTPSSNSPLVSKLIAVFHQLKPSLPPIRNDIAWLLGFIARANHLDAPPRSLNDATPQQLVKTIEALKQRLK